LCLWEVMCQASGAIRVMGPKKKKNKRKPVTPIKSIDRKGPQATISITHPHPHTSTCLTTITSEAVRMMARLSEEVNVPSDMPRASKMVVI
jgi:hypothetical protein